MSNSTLLQLMANCVLIVHVGFILFVVAGLVIVLVGGFRKWGWVRSFRLRLLHISAIGVVVLESWADVRCPLTTLEHWLRRAAGQVVSTDDFIAFWLRRLFFFQAPPWVFTALYTGFFTLVVSSWLMFPPRMPSRQGSSQGDE